MNIIIQPNHLKGNIEAITSKSHAHRLMIAAALCQQPCKVNINNMNQDLYATEDCLSSLNDDIPLLNCNESGSTLRFMLPIAMALKEEVSFYGKGRLPERPLSPLKEELEAHGCCFYKENLNSFSPLSKDLNSFPPLSEVKDLVQNEVKHIYTIKGRLMGGTFNLAGNISSQYITGLLFALPLLNQDSTINITSKLESIGYVLLTLEVLAQFGIKIECDFSYNEKTETHCVFYVKGNQKYISPKEVTAEGDWSNAAFWLVAGALSKDISCSGLNYDSVQGDKAIVPFIETVLSASCEDLYFDVSDVPDLVPILAVLATSRNGVTHITNAARLRIKESDRLATVRELIINLGGKVDELPDGLIIYGTGNLVGGTVDGHNDHRIVMAATIASILCSHPVTILGAEAVNKSYPKFLFDFSLLGGKYVIN